MKNSHNNYHGIKRRILLRYSFLAALFGLSAGKLRSATIPSEVAEDSDTVSLITSNGKLVYVKRKHLPPPTTAKATNKEVKAWMLSSSEDKHGS